MQYAKHQLLNQFAIELLNNGFRIVLHTDELRGWIHFGKDGKVGYVEQKSPHAGLTFSTKHKPCRECGTGFRIHSDIFEPTIEHATDCFTTPAWASKFTFARYKDLEEIAHYESKFFKHVSIITPETITVSKTDDKSVLVYVNNEIHKKVLVWDFREAIADVSVIAESRFNSGEQTIFLTLDQCAELLEKLN